jgi:hypothetical protein
MENTIRDFLFEQGQEAWRDAKRKDLINDLIARGYKRGNIEQYSLGLLEDLAIGEEKYEN